MEPLNLAQLVITKGKDGLFKVVLMSTTQVEDVYEGVKINAMLIIEALMDDLVHVEANPTDR